MVAPSSQERVLILAKTYPSPSAKYVETSCVAGITDSGSVRRLFPVPFRLIDGDRQFKKWQWIDAQIYKSNEDHRPESYKIYVDTIELGDVISTDRDWEFRRTWIEKCPSFSSFEQIELAQEGEGLSLAILRPKRVIDLEIKPSDRPDWTDEDLEKLLKDELRGQGNLFDDEPKAQMRLLRKIPQDFYYRYVCDTSTGEVERKHKIVDWEIGQLYLNCEREHGTSWEKPFRAKMESFLLGRDLMFLMGNLHRFQNQWLIVSLIYPPKQKPGSRAQQSLF